MVSPVLDEDAIKGMLKVAPTAEHGNMLQSGAAQTLLDMYDRCATRQEFIENAVTCIQLYANVAKLQILQGVKDCWVDGELGPNSFATAEKQLGDLIRKQAEAAIELIKRLQMCSSNEDTVN